MIISVHHDGTHFGSFPIEALNRGIKAGTIPFRGALGWHEGLIDWVPLAELEGVVAPESSAFDPGPPQPTEPAPVLPPAIERVWHYAKAGMRHGPVSRTEIQQMVQDGRLNASDTIWVDGMPAWTPVRDSEFFSPPPLPPPPFPVAVASNTLVWIVAFVPLIGLFIEGMFFRAPGSLSMLIFAANVALCYLDEKKLNEAGHSTKAMGASVFFIPVYLWKRSELLRQNKAYFIVWIVCFAVWMSA